MSTRDAFTVLLAHRSRAQVAEGDAHRAHNLAIREGASARKVAGLDAAIQDYLYPVESSTDAES